MSVWISSEQVCELTGWTDRWVRRLATEGKLDTRACATRARNGRPGREYALASLPAEIRAKYLGGKSLPQPAEKPERRPSESPLTLTPLFATPGSALAVAAQTTALQPAPVRVALTPAAEKEAARRIAILKPLLDYLATPETRGRFHQLALSNGELVTSSDSLARFLSEQHGISRSTIWNWKRQFDKQGSLALARKPRADKHRSTWAAEHRDLADLAVLVFLGNAEQPAQSKMVAWEAVCERARRQGIEPPSYEALRSFLSNPNEVSPSMRVYGREGKRAYQAQFAPYISRSYTEPAYAIVVSDHMIHDCLVQNDVFGARGLEHMRLQMTTLLDYRSRYVVGVSWCENGSSVSVKRALLQAFTNHGLFDQFYCDNGKDYRKVARGARAQDLAAMDAAGQLCVEETQSLSTSVMQRLDIPVTFCTPFHPQAKHIERYHRTVHERFDKAFVTYTAGAPHLRPDAATAALARHGKLLHMGRTAESQLPLASDFIQMCRAWIDTWYHQQPQDGEGMNGRTPAEVFAAERGPVRPSPEPAVLAMLLCERVSRKVLNGQIELGSGFYVPDLTDHWANLQMHERSGRRVTVAFDPMDPMYVAVLDEDLHFLCRLQHKELMRFSSDDETRDKVGAFISNRNGLRKAVRESIQDLNRRVRAKGYVSLEDSMRQRLDMPRAVNDAIVQRPPSPAQEADTFKTTHSEDNVARYMERMGGAHGTHR